MADWRKSQHLKYKATMAAKAAAKRGRASFNSGPTVGEHPGDVETPEQAPSVDQGRTPPPPVDASKLDNDNVYIPDTVLDPPTLEEKMTQLARAIRLRTIDECFTEVYHAVTDIHEALRKKGRL